MTWTRITKGPSFYLLGFSILLGILSASGCSTRTLTKPMLLPVLPQPTLIPVPFADLQCLSNQTYVNIVNREGALRLWGQKQYNVIKANNDQAKKH